MPRPRVREGRLVEVAAHQVVRRQDDEVNGTREPDATESVCQRTTVDQLEASRLIMHVDGWSNQLVCQHRVLTVVNDGEYQPRGNKDHHNDTQQNPAYPSRRAPEASQ